MSLGGKRVLLLSYSRIASDPRVMRQVRSLASRTSLTVAGFGSAPAVACEFVPLRALAPGVTAPKLAALGRLALRRFDAYARTLPQAIDARAALTGRRFDLVVCNDLSAAPLAAELAQGAPILLDAHEFSPREFEERATWRLLFAPYMDYLCRTYLPRAQAFTTVAAGIADEYRAVYGRQADVVLNAPPRQALQPSPLDDSRVRLVHHGAAMPGRRIEAIIDAVERLEARYELDLMLVPGDPRCLVHLTDQVKGNPRIRVVPPVRMEEIIPFTNRYDVGINLTPPTNINHVFQLPNKFFEFIQARLAVAIGPSPEMQRLVQKYDCGVVSEDFTPAAMARALSALTPERLAQLKANAHRAADELCWEKQEPVFLAAVERALGAAR